MPTAKRPKHLAHGRHISDFWLNGKAGALHPAEEKLLACAARGKMCELDKIRPTNATKDNRIRAEFLRFVALGGDGEHPLHDHGLMLHGAFVECGENGLDFEGAKIPENLQLEKCHIDGAVMLRDALAESMSFEGSQIASLDGDRLEMTGGLFLTKVKAKNTVDLVGAKIGSDLACRGGTFNGAEKALSCDGMETAGGVFLDNGFKAKGEVRLLGAIIGNDLCCEGGEFASEGSALDLEGATIGGACFLREGFRAMGSVNLTYTKIGSYLVLTNAVFAATNNALHAPRATVGGNVIFGEGFVAEGPVSFQGATINGDMAFTKGVFRGKPAMNLKNSTIGNTLIWRDVTEATGQLNLSAASCQTINMDRASWEKPSEIVLDAFTYRGFSQLPSGCDSKFWRRWIERQPKKHLTTQFRPNPYSQLAKVLEAMGHTGEATSVRIEQARQQNTFRAEHEAVPPTPTGRMLRSMEVFWNRVQGAIVDYGFRPGKAILFLFGLIVLGNFVYLAAAHRGIMTPTHPLIFKEAGNLFPKACTENYVYKPHGMSDTIWNKCQAGMPSEYSTFSSFMYSMDVALPIVNFRMTDDWSPRVVDWQSGGAPDFQAKPLWGWGWWVRTWEWIQIVLGWILSLIFVSAIGGIIRK